MPCGPRAQLVWPLGPPHLLLCKRRCTSLGPNVCHPPTTLPLRSCHPPKEVFRHQHPPGHFGLQPWGCKPTPRRCAQICGVLQPWAQPKFDRVAWLVWAPQPNFGWPHRYGAVGFVPLVARHHTCQPSALVGTCGGCGGPRRAAIGGRPNMRAAMPNPGANTTYHGGGTVGPLQTVFVQAQAQSLRWGLGAGG